ncbi:MAG TPA: hypothetical protein VMC62_12050 [Longilinea sp.]|nr:hypothetical protein [Longilinea sp.]
MSESAERISLAKQIEQLTHQFVELWWQCDSSFPAFEQSFTPADHGRNDAALQDYVRRMEAELKALPTSADGREAARQRIMDFSTTFARNTLGFTNRQLNVVLSHGFLDVSARFAEEARRFDPTVREEDIYQASRNVMTMNFIQLLLGQPVTLTPAIFAYSMLYPYTDNYLDDPAVSADDKHAFIERFRRRLEGETLLPTNQHERLIWELVWMVEQQYPRAQYGRVYESLYAIHDAQCRSLKLLSRVSSPYEVDVLSLIFEKGGASVLADGYLVAGDLTEEQSRFMFAYGAYTQMMDDMEDILSDRAAGVQTLFSQTAGRWPLDELTNHTFHFGDHVFRTLDCFTGAEAEALKELIWRAVDPMLIASAGTYPQFYTRPYLKRLEEHLPFSYAGLQKVRTHLEKEKFSMVGLVKAFAPSAKTIDVRLSAFNLQSQAILP